MLIDLFMECRLQFLSWNYEINLSDNPNPLSVISENRWNIIGRIDLALDIYPNKTA